ncbi:MAG: hypothetical protein Q8P18_16270 [Pseudomonadota bacterium]|nr:hypothetical protein [Pseudomonadota bacterium]
MSVVNRWSWGVLLVSLTTACTPEPCPPREGAERLEAVNTEQRANPKARALATRWGAEQGADDALVARVAQALDQQASSVLFWEALWVAEPRYAAVANGLDARRLPDALAVIPFALGGYADAALGPECRTGAWLLAPTALGVRVSDCRVRGSAELWSPPGEPEGGLYEATSGCRVAKCEVDERRNFAKATEAALAALEETWRSTPDAPGKLETRLAAETGRGPALVVAWHLLAECFFGNTDQSAARWRPRPAWCEDAPVTEFAMVARCSAQPPFPP